MEFDTVSETFVANHQPKVGFGATPEASPDGRHIVLFANDGGQNLRVLRAGPNGEASTVAFDVAMDFENVPPAREAISDFAFVQWKNHNLLALASGYDNELALIDLGVNSPTVTKLKLSNSMSPTGGNGGRMVEWAYGTDYLWVDASDAEEAYIIRLSEDGDVAKAAVERTVADLPSSKLIYVENFAERAQVQFLSEVFATDDASASDSSTSQKSNLAVSEIKAQLEEDGYFSDSSEDNSPSVVAIVGLVLGVVSLLTNIVLMVMFFSQKNGAATGNATKDDEDKTLGSKRVA